MSLSPRNPEVARLRELTRNRRARHDAGRFVVEGAKLVAEVLASDLAVHQIGWSEGSPLPAAIAEAARADDVDTLELSERAFERIASTTSPQPVLAEVELPSRSLPGDATAVLVAVDVNDPGNLGTMVRSAVAAGFDAVVALGDTADPWGPKSVRASAGALFRCPVVIERDTAAGASALSEAGLVRVGTRMDDGVACDRFDLSQPVALLMGNEAHGLGASDAAVDEWVTIAMPGDVESLNVAMAATVLVWEVSRQRRA